MPHCILIRDRPEFSADTSKNYGSTFVIYNSKVEISEQNAEIAYMGRVQISKPKQTFLGFYQNYVSHNIILLHDHFEGCIEIANHKGVISSSQGAKPRGMKK